MKNGAFIWNETLCCEGYFIYVSIFKMSKHFKSTMFNKRIFWGLVTKVEPCEYVCCFFRSVWVAHMYERFYIHVDEQLSNHPAKMQWTRITSSFAAILHKIEMWKTDGWEMCACEYQQQQHQQKSEEPTATLFVGWYAMHGQNISHT